MSEISSGDFFNEERKEVRKTHVEIAGIEVPVFERPEGEGSEFLDEHFKDFVQDSTARAMLKILARDEKLARFNGRAISPLLEGPTDIGKTRTVEYYAHKTGRKLIRLQCTQNTDVSDLIGKWVPAHPDIAQMFTEKLMAYREHYGDSDVRDAGPKNERAGLRQKTQQLLDAAKAEHRPLTIEEARAIAVAEGMDIPAGANWVWKDGLVVQAMKQGAILLLDEINMLKGGVRVRLQSVFEDHPTLSLQENGGKRVAVADGFYAVCTQNPPSYGGGREPTPLDMMRRHDYHTIPELPRADLEARYAKAVSAYESTLPMEFQDILINFHEEIKRMVRSGELGRDQAQKFGIEFTGLVNLGAYLALFDPKTSDSISVKSVVREAAEHCYAGKFSNADDRVKVMAVLERFLAVHESSQEREMRERAKRLAEENRDLLTTDITYTAPPDPKKAGTVRRRRARSASIPEGEPRRSDGSFTALEIVMNQVMEASGTSERFDFSHETLQIPEYWTDQHDEAVAEALGLDLAKGDMAITCMPSPESLHNLDSEYLRAFYPMMKREDPYLAFRSTWFARPAEGLETTGGSEAYPGKTYWDVYQKTMLETTQKLTGARILIDMATKPRYVDGKQSYELRSGSPDSIPGLLQEYFGKVPPITHRFARTHEELNEFCGFLKEKIIERMRRRGLAIHPDDISVQLPPALIMNILMSTSDAYYPSSKTNTWEWTGDIVTDASGNPLKTPRALLVGNSGNGGAADLSGWNRDGRNGFGGFRPAVIVRKHT